MGYKLTKKAEEDILSVFEQGLREFGVRQAERYHNSLENLFELLSGMPEMGREFNEITPPVRLYSHLSHIIIYHVQDDKSILIIRVRHCREDWLRSLLE